MLSISTEYIIDKDCELKVWVSWLVLPLFFFNICLPFNAFVVGAETFKSSISIQSNVNGAHLFINGRDSGLQTPFAELLVVEPGFYKLSLEKEGHTSWRKEFLLSPGEMMPLTATLLPLDVSESQKEAFKGLGKKPVTETWWFWTIVLVGIGVAISASDVDDEGTVLITW